jgi:hypothetical protein
MNSCAVLAPNTVRVVVRFGSSEHPEPASAVYVRAADDTRFHFVRRLNGELVRVHENQMDPKFVEVLAQRSQGSQNVFPGGRW